MSTFFKDRTAYKGEIVKWGLTESGEKATPTLFFTCLVKAEIAPDGADVDCPNYERTVFRYLTPDAIDYAVEDLKLLGFTGTSFDTLVPDHPQAHDFMGQEVKLWCKHEPGNDGKARERWQFSKGARELPAMDKSKTSKLNALFGSKLKQAAAGSAAGKAPSKPAAPAKTVEEEFSELV